MKNSTKEISNRKFVLKAAQSVWAANKYLVLACDQEAYRDIRQLLKPQNPKLTTAYIMLKNTEEKYRSLPSHELPQISNALYHMAGYFKMYWSSNERQEINNLIKRDPEQALAQLEEQSHLHEIEYLLRTRLWNRERVKPFNNVPISLKHESATYEANQLLWEKELVIHNS